MIEINQEYMSALGDGERKALSRKFPSLFWAPNIAQRRLFKHWLLQPYPRVHVITYGNRTGKTEALAEFLCGVTKGSRYVNPVYCQSQFFDDLEEKRLDGVLTVWWVCDADLMKQNGADYKIIRKHIPDAEFKFKTNNGVYREIHVPVLGRDKKVKVSVVIHVKTHDQETTSFSADNVDVIICDEPPPQKHWGEISARMINLAGDPGGRIVIGGTPLKLCAYLLDIIEGAEEDNDDNRVIHDKGSIWENCIGNEVPDEIAKAYNIPKGADGVYETGGFLSREGIENAIKNWEKDGDPDTLLARRDGEFTHVQGRLFKVFNKAAHVIKPMTIPKLYPIIQCVDPHDSRPDCSGWYMITPGNKLICVAEYPTEPYETMVSRTDTIPQTCAEWSRIEAELGISEQIYARYGDPIYMNDPDPYTKKTKQQLYKMHGFDFNTNLTANVEYGHEKIRQFLYYDKMRWEVHPEDPMYQPQLLFFDTCRNHIVFMTKYSTKTQRDMSKPISEQVDKKWSDYVALIRYACTVFQPFASANADLKDSRAEWKRIKQARDPMSNSTDLGYKNKPVFSIG